MIQRSGPNRWQGSNSSGTVSDISSSYLAYVLEELLARHPSVQVSITLSSTPRNTKWYGDSPSEEIVKQQLEWNSKDIQAMNWIISVPKFKSARTQFEPQWYIMTQSTFTLAISKTSPASLPRQCSLSESKESIPIAVEYMDHESNVTKTYCTTVQRWKTYWENVWKNNPNLDHDIVPFGPTNARVIRARIQSWLTSNKPDSFDHAIEHGARLFYTIEEYTVITNPDTKRPHDVIRYTFAPKYAD